MKKRRAIIVTHPFMGNYGGMLQAFALRKAVMSLGVDAVILDTSQCPSMGVMQTIKYIAKNVLLCIGAAPENIKMDMRFYWSVAHDFKKLIGDDAFMSEKRLISREKNDVFIVGSDQVWRTHSGVPNDSVLLYFLNFLTSEERRRSFAYAASFGTSAWHASASITKQCCELLQDFNSVSVREDTGIEICSNIFGVRAKRVIDPTLLLDSSDYEEFIDTENEEDSGTYLASYILDSTPAIKSCIVDTCRSLNLSHKPLSPIFESKIRKNRYPVSVSTWLRLIKNCKYLITDSFHGCVFSIIFNKPFVCLGNEYRGNVRFDTLFNLFNLQSRLLSRVSLEEIITILSRNIDWYSVNQIIDDERKRSYGFLAKNLEVN